MLSKIIRISTCALCLGTIISSLSAVAMENDENVHEDVVKSERSNTIKRPGDDDIYFQEYKRLISFYKFDEKTAMRIVRLYRKKQKKEIVKHTPLDLQCWL